MRRPVLFFIVSLHFLESKKRLFIPLPLFLVEMIAEGTIFWKPIFKLIAKSEQYHKLESNIIKHVNFKMHLEHVLEMLSEVWLEFRALEKFEFVNIETPDIKVKIYTY